MDQAYASTNYGGDAAGNYEKFFVPSIGGPIAADLLTKAELKSGERVLDVACGTGIVTRKAAKMVKSDDGVTGLDFNPGMLAVAREVTDGVPIEWIESSAEDMPFGSETFDVVLCQMGLQFIENKLAALREMHRVLAPGGRALITVPGPKPSLFAAMGEGAGRHFGEEAAMFMDLVFSLHDRNELSDLFSSAGFGEVSIEAEKKTLLVPPPREFLWQYIHSTPLAQAAMNTDPSVRDALEAEVCPKWTDMVEDGKTRIDVVITTILARN